MPRRRNGGGSAGTVIGLITAAGSFLWTRILVLVLTVIGSGFKEVFRDSCGVQTFIRR